MQNSDIIEKVEIAGPGFINFFIRNDSLTKIISDILKNGENYFKSNIGGGTKIMVEYVSANPTGDLHLGHARGAAYGDTLTRILSFVGYDVLREYYVNDAGNQIEVLGNSLYLKDIKRHLDYLLIYQKLVIKKYLREQLYLFGQVQLRSKQI